MVRNFKDVVILMITSGVLILLGVIIIGDYWVALEENRPVDESVITLMKMSVTGLIGVIGGYKIGSITKQKYQQDGTSYKIRAQQNFNLSPFKLDLITRITFGDIGLFGRYSMTTLFKDGKTLELTPFAAGITIGNFTKQRHK